MESVTGTRLQREKGPTLGTSRVQSDAPHVQLHKMGESVVSLLWLYAKKQAQGKPVQAEIPAKHIA